MSLDLVPLHPSQILLPIVPEVPGSCPPDEHGILDHGESLVYFGAFCRQQESTMVTTALV